MGRTVVFGLSANPPTGLGGHAGIVRWAATKENFAELGGDTVDEVWVLPVYVHAFEEKQRMASFEHRLRMSELAFLNIEGVPPGKVRVLDTERRLYEARPGQKIGTIDVVRWLRAEYPGRQFALMLGEDTYADLAAGRWKESAQLMALAPVIVVPRIGVDAGIDGVERDDGPILTAVSSSAVRKSADLAYLATALQPAVMEYLIRHRLYAFGDKSRTR